MAIRFVSPCYPGTAQQGDPGALFAGVGVFYMRNTWDWLHLTEWLVGGWGGSEEEAGWSRKREFFYYSNCKGG